MRRLPLLALAAILAACGGGGGSATPEATSPNREATLADTDFAAITGHFNQLNQVRGAMGLPVLKWNAALATGAQRHADYLRINGELGHGETPGLPLYVSASAAERGAKAGYPGSLVAEVLVSGVSTTQYDGQSLMDQLLAAPGHRTVLLAPEFNDAGMGTAPMTTLLGANGAAFVEADKVMVYPYHGQTSVQRTFAPATESPNPLPGVAMTGMPISVQGGRLFESFTVSGARLRETGSGADVALLPGEPVGTSRAAFVFYPELPLKLGTSYSFSADVLIAGKARSVASVFTTVAY